MPRATAPDTIESLRRRLDYANKRVAYAWAKYYESVNNDLNGDIVVYQTITRTCEEMPTHIKNEFREMASTLKKKWECPICIDMIEAGDLDISNCGHFYCKDCLKTLIETQKTSGKDKWECAVCRKKHNYKEE